jgi:hypothetical protein
LSAGKAASATPPAPAAHQQAGHSSADPAKRQEQAAISSVSPALVSKLPLFFQLLLLRYEDVVNPSKVLPQISHGVEHHLETRGPPIASPFRRLDGQKLAVVKAEFAALERDGIIRWSSSPWVSPLHMVKKPDGPWHCCGDFRGLNNVTVPDTYPLPNMMDFSSRVAGCSIFSKIDFRKGIIKFLSTLLTSWKAAIITPFGLFEFVRLTFGLRSVESTFQQLMDPVLAGLSFTIVYLNDIIIASPSMEQHQRDVEEVFRRLQAAPGWSSILRSAPVPSRRWISWATECPPAISPPPSPAGWPPSRSTRGRGWSSSCWPS